MFGRGLFNSTIVGSMLGGAGGGGAGGGGGGGRHPFSHLNYNNQWIPSGESGPERMRHIYQNRQWMGGQSKPAPTSPVPEQPAPQPELAPAQPAMPISNFGGLLGRANCLCSGS